MTRFPDVHVDSEHAWRTYGARALGPLCRTVVQIQDQTISGGTKTNKKIVIIILEIVDGLG